jgi:hypothetical protein
VTALGSFRTYEFTESVEFCGTVCHTPMKPEYTAYLESPHARVACAECHIGSGATWFVKSKLSGTYQVYSTLMNRFARPIPTPLKSLRPAQQTCEKCHWPGKFFGDTAKVLHHYLADEQNSPWTIQLLLKIGGGDPSFGPVGGIHWHMNISNKVEYIATDDRRKTIPWVAITDQNGKVTVYQSTGNSLKPAQVAAAPHRVMDCIDCHNRPTHIYHSPIESVDRAIYTGRISSRIPFIKKQAVLALTGKYATAEEAGKGISRTLAAYYQSRHADFANAHPELLKNAIAEVRSIYAHNFFPEMKVNWRAYPDNIGHKEFSGCFRCHDGNHVSADGKRITRDCRACHTIIAQGPGETPPSIDPAGMDFKHPVDIQDTWKQMDCSYCHAGAPQ